MTYETPRPRRSYTYTTIYGSLSKVIEFNKSFRDMLLKGWEEDGSVNYVATPPTGKIVCIQRFRRPSPDNPLLTEIDSVHA
tara:strand:+ start:3297 stop:3539 length:243 start_codon:yes stop_codon:yes gene_type:complete